MHHTNPFPSSLNDHLCRLAVLALNGLFNRRFVFQLVGIINKRFNFLVSVFVAYPASEAYASKYAYPRHRHLMRWTPWPVGVFRQDGKWGVTFVISSTEHDFTDPANKANLRNLVSHMETIRVMLGARQKTFAGILPGVLFRQRLIRDAVEADTTVAAVMKAEAAVRQAEGFTDTTPIILLGSRGFIGRRLAGQLRDREIYGLDIEGDTNAWPGHLVGRDALLINLTRKAVLNTYVEKFWPALVVINEVYPEPSPAEVDRLTGQGCRAYHIVGVSGQAYPPFPKAYRGGIPCCAARVTSEMEIVVHRLT